MQITANRFNFTQRRAVASKQTTANKNLTFGNKTYRLGNYNSRTSNKKTNVFAYMFTALLGAGGAKTCEYIIEKNAHPVQVAPKELKRAVIKELPCCGVTVVEE
jgi:hypothetical protein